MDPASLAAGAVGALVPYLAEAGKGMATKAGGAAWEGCEKLWTLLKSKLPKPEQQSALADLAAQPTDPDVQAAARVQLRKAATCDNDLLREIAGLLTIVESSGGQTATIINSDNAVSNQADRGSTITFNR